MGTWFPSRLNNTSEPAQGGQREHLLPGAGKQQRRLNLTLSHWSAGQAAPSSAESPSCAGPCCMELVGVNSVVPPGSRKAACLWWSRGPESGSRCGTAIGSEPGSHCCWGWGWGVTVCGRVVGRRVPLLSAGRQPERTPKSTPHTGPQLPSSGSSTWDFGRRENASPGVRLLVISSVSQEVLREGKLLPRGPESQAQQETAPESALGWREPPACAACCLAILGGPHRRPSHRDRSWSTKDRVARPRL